MAAMDEPSLVASMEFMRGYETGLSSVRYPRDVISTRFASACPKFELGKARQLSGPPLQGESDAPAPPGRGRSTPDVAVLAFGTCAITAAEAAELVGPSITTAVCDARFAKPVDRDLIRAILERGIPLITIEDHSIIGGFGTAVLEAAQEMSLDASLVTRLGLPDSWIYQDSRAKQLAEVGLDVAGIAKAIRDAAALRERTFAPAK
jgi:deoxyxylulose-5-phosphate synthase